MRARLILSLAFAMPLTGCLIGKRLNSLEAQTQALTLQNERLDSTTEAIEKNRHRLDGMVPGDAQWMELELGGILRWYLGDDLGNAYVQFREAGAAPGEVTVAFSSSIKNAPYTLRPGISISHQVPSIPQDAPPADEDLENDGAKQSFITLTLHRVRYDEGQSPKGLFSVTVESY